MPKINVMQQQTTANNLGPTPQAQGQRFISAMGEGANAVSAGLNNLSTGLQAEQKANLEEQKFLQHQQEEDGKAYAAKAVAQAQIDQMTHMQELQQSAAPGAPDFAGSFDKQFAEYSAKAIEQAPTPAAKKFVTQHMESLRPQLFNQALTFEAKAKVDYRNDAFTKSTIDVSKVIAADPTEQNIQKQLQFLTETNPAGTPQERSARLDFAEKTLRTSAWASLVQRDPAAAKKMIDGVFKGAEQTPTATAPDATATPSKPSFMPPPVNKTVMQYLPDVQAAGAAKGVDPSFMLAQLQVESAGNKNAVNTTDGGSAGIAQFQAGTAKRYGIDPRDPKQAIQGQAAYMSDLLKMFGGDYKKAAAGYNWGEGNVQKAVAKYGDAWASHIPATTKDYLAKIDKLTGGVQGGTPASPDVQPDARIPSNSALIRMTPIDELLHWQNQAESGVRKNLDDFQTQLRAETRDAEAQAQAGVMPTSQSRTLSDFRAAFPDNQVAADQAFEAYDTARKTAVAVVEMQQKPTAQLAQVLSAEPPAGADANVIKSHAIQSNAAQQIIKGRQEDPWAYAINNHEFNAKIIDPSSNTFADTLKQRVAALPTMMQKYGVAPSLLSKPEAAAMSAKLNSLPGDQRIQMLNQLRGAISDDQVYTGLLNIIRPDSPVTAMAGNIAQLGGTIGLGGVPVNKAEVARRIAIGEDLLNKVKSDKASDGNRGGFPMPKEDQLAQAFNDAVGSAYAGFPEARSHAYEAYRAYYASQAATRGVFDPKAGVDDKIAREAITAATGGVTDWGGHWYGGAQKLILPYGMNPSAFKDSVAANWTAIAKANGYSKTDVSEIGLKPTGQNGVYMVMSGTSWLPDKNGEPITINALSSVKPAPTGAAPVRESNQAQTGKIRRDN